MQPIVETTATSAVGASRRTLTEVIALTTEDSDRSNLNTGTPWSRLAIRDLEHCVRRGDSIEEIAGFLCRTQAEVRQKIEELGFANE